VKDHFYNFPKIKTFALEFCNWVGATAGTAESTIQGNVQMFCLFVCLFHLDPPATRNDESSCHDRGYVDESAFVVNCCSFGATKQK